MTFKLATAAAMVLASATASNAADLAKKAPAAVDYVKVCDTYGAGFFYIPGSETCLKIGGYVRVNIMGGAGDDYLGAPYHGKYEGGRTNNSMSTSVRSLVSLDARSMTEYGLLRAYSELEFNTKSGSENGDDIVGKAFIQWGGWSAGHKTSNWDYYTGSAMGAVYGQEAHDDTVTLLSYTFGLGNGVTATVGIEDPTYAGRYDDTAAAGNYGGVKAPDVVANINVTQAWGSAQVMGALHQDYGSTSVNDGGWGWAVGAGVKVALPMLGAGDEIAIQAAYGDGANRYVSGQLSSAAPAIIDDFNANGDHNTSWSVLGGFKHVFSPALSAAIDVGYSSYDDKISGFDLEQLTVRGDVTWTPVTNLLIRAGVDYRSTDMDGFQDGDSWAATLRVQRNF